MFLFNFGGVGLLFCIQDSAVLLLFLPNLSPRSSLWFLKARGGNTVDLRVPHLQGRVEATDGCLGAEWAFLPKAAGAHGGCCSGVEPFSVGLAGFEVWFCVCQARTAILRSWSLLSPAVCQPLASRVPRGRDIPDLTHQRTVITSRG